MSHGQLRLLRELPAFRRTFGLHSLFGIPFDPSILFHFRDPTKKGRGRPRISKHDGFGSGTQAIADKQAALRDQGVKRSKHARFDARIEHAHFERTVHHHPSKNRGGGVSRYPAYMQSFRWRCRAGDAAWARGGFSHMLATQGVSLGLLLVMLRRMFLEARTACAKALRVCMIA